MGHITFMKPVGAGVSWIFSTVVVEPLSVRTKVFTYELPSSSLVVTAKRRGGSFSVTSPSIRLSGLRGSQPKDSNVEPTAFGSPESQFARYGFGDQSAWCGRSPTSGQICSGVASISTVQRSCTGLLPSAEDARP